jgi:hypothetical protein
MSHRRGERVEGLCRTSVSSVVAMMMDDMGVELLVQ